MRSPRRGAASGDVTSTTPWLSHCYSWASSRLPAHSVVILTRALPQRFYHRSDNSSFMIVIFVDTVCDLSRHIRLCSLRLCFVPSVRVGLGSIVRKYLRRLIGSRVYFVSRFKFYQIFYNYLALELVAFITINHPQQDIRNIFAICVHTKRNI